jgi:pantoate--beta-alanine ligase
VDELTEPLCGRTRPGHFVGVTTVVAKLFNIVQPAAAVFGQKDAQQALVIREMTVQLDIPVRLHLAAIAREDDGLARSSRNAYLDPDERRRASAINGALVAATERIREGERDPATVAAGAIRHMIDGGVDDVEYVELRGAEDLCALDTIEGKVILAVAARVGGTRLIDNVVLEVAGDGSVARAMLF